MIRKLIISCLLLLTFPTLAESNITSVRTDSVGYLFEFDLKYIGANYNIDMNYQYVLEHLYELATQDTSLYIHVRGHVCCGPAYRLSKKRAKKVYKYLKKLGVPKDRLSYKGYSDTAPLVFPEKTAEDEAKNRRVDFILYRHTY